MTTIRTVDISDRDYEKIRSPLTTVLILSNDRGNFCPVRTALARSHGSLRQSACSSSRLYCWITQGRSD
jgi:hypothetical protein